MPLLVPQGGRESRLSDQRPSGPLSDGGSITFDASGTPHAVGAYVEIDASLSVDVSGIMIRNVNNVNTAGADTSTILEIATGAAAAEVVKARVVLGHTNSGTLIHVPIYIPAGTRVAGRARSVVASKQIVEFVTFIPVSGGLRPSATPELMGFDLANSRGTLINNSGVINTDGAWTELVAATTQRISLLSIMPSGGSSNNLNNSTIRLDIAVGAAAAEVAILSDVIWDFNTNEAIIPRYVLSYGVDIPAGSRISARYQSATATNPVDVALVGA